MKPGLQAGRAGKRPGAEVWAVVPARGGSKGLPGKNLKTVGGVSLVARAVLCAKKSRFVSRVIVSTDCPKIAREALKYGAEVPYLRPATLAGDRTPMKAVLVELLEHLSAVGPLPGRLVLLQPTSPLRTAKTLDRCLNAVTAAGARSAVSVCAAKITPHWMRTIGRGGRLAPVPGHTKEFFARQELPEYYRLNGAIYVTQPALILRGRGIVEEKPLAFVMNETESVDVDTRADLEIARVFEKLSRSAKRAL